MAIITPPPANIAGGLVQASPVAITSTASKGLLPALSLNPLTAAIVIGAVTIWTVNNARIERDRAQADELRSLDALKKADETYHEIKILRIKYLKGDLSDEALSAKLKEIRPEYKDEQINQIVENWKGLKSQQNTSTNGIGNNSTPSELFKNIPALPVPRGPQPVNIFG